MESTNYSLDNYKQARGHIYRILTCLLAEVAHATFAMSNYSFALALLFFPPTYYYNLNTYIYFLQILETKTEIKQDNQTGREPTYKSFLL